MNDVGVYDPFMVQWFMSEVRLYEAVGVIHVMVGKDVSGMRRGSMNDVGVYDPCYGAVVCE